MSRRHINAAPRAVQVFDTPSGLGGSFTVSIVEDRGETCLVRVWYGRATHSGWEAWLDWDGYQFTCRRDALHNPHLMPLYKAA